MSRQLPLKYEQFALVDDEDYPRLMACRWLFQWPGRIVGYVPIDGEYQVFPLAHFLLNIPQDLQVVHRNGDRLDLRRCNLLILTPQPDAVQTPQRDWWDRLRQKARAVIQGMNAKQRD